MSAETQYRANKNTVEKNTAVDVITLKKLKSFSSILFSRHNPKIKYRLDLTYKNHLPQAYIGIEHSESGLEAIADNVYGEKFTKVQLKSHIDKEKYEFNCRIYNIPKSYKKLSLKITTNFIGQNADTPPFTLFTDFSLKMGSLPHPVKHYSITDVYVENGYWVIEVTAATQYSTMQLKSSKGMNILTIL